MHFFCCAILCVEPSIHAWRRSFHLLRREISQPFAQDTSVTCHMHSLVNLLLGIGHHPSLKSQSVSFFSHFLNWIRLYYDAFFTRGYPRSQATHILCHQPQLASVYTSHKMACTPATTRQRVHQSQGGVVPHVKKMSCGHCPLCSTEYPPKTTVSFLEPHSTFE